jgi:hypothetical protein
MRYMVLLKGSQMADPPPPELMEAIAQLGEEPPSQERRSTPLGWPRAQWVLAWI